MSVCRKIGVACFIFLILTCCSQYVFAQDDKNYIVYLNNDVNLLQEEPSQAYSVVDEDTLNALLESNIVEWYEEDFEVLLFDSDEAVLDPLLSHKWDLTMIDAGYLWNFGCYGESIKTAVIDSAPETIRISATIFWKGITISIVLRMLRTISDTEPLSMGLYLLSETISG